MTEKKRPLPRPPRKPFVPGGRAPGLPPAPGGGGDAPERNLEEDPNARRLAEMMMGLTGMPPLAASAGGPGPDETAGDAAPGAPRESGPGTGRSAPVPEDVMKAAAAGDVSSLIGLLRREHRERHGEADEAPPSSGTGGSPQPEKTEESGFIEKEVLDALIRMARDNDVSVDWLIARALRLYVRDYRTTGRM